MRIVLAIAILVALAGTAAAGLRCKRLPRIVFWSEAADVHDDGIWHRTRKGVEANGRFTGVGLGRFSGLLRGTREEPAVLRCLDALIANESSATAKRACTPPKRT